MPGAQENGTGTPAGCGEDQVVNRLRFAGGSDSDPVQARNLSAFFGLVILLSIPLWVYGAVSQRELFPGVSISAVMAVCPLIAASILTVRERGIAGVGELLRRSVDISRIRPLGWYVPMLLTMPVVSIVMYVVMRWMSIPLPADVRIAWALLPFLVVVLFILGLTEEAGWMGYAADPMLSRWTALQASLLLGVFWAVWHFIPLLIGGRELVWMIWWTMFTVSSRVVIFWLYNNTNRSVLAAILFHVTMNLGFVLFPNDGSHYDYRIAGPLMALMAVAVALIWGPRTLAGNSWT